MHTKLHISSRPQQDEKVSSGNNFPMRKALDLVERYKRGIHFTAAPSQTQTVSSGSSLPMRKVAALDFVERYKISLPSAYRHLKAGTIPSDKRGIGLDGRSYPTHRSNAGPKRTPIQKELLLARQALQRAQRRANEDGIEDDDLVLLQEVNARVTVMLETWRAAE